MNLQQPGGWIGKEPHGTDQLEGCIRLLREKGVESNHSVVGRGLDAIVKRGADFVGAAYSEFYTAENIIMNKNSSRDIKSLFEY